MADPQMPVSLGGYGENQPAPGVDTSNFFIRTPPQGIPLGDVAVLSGDFGRSTSEVSPGALGIPQEAIDYFRLQNQKQEQSSFNVGIKALFPDGVVPDFMDKVLRPKSASVSYGRSEFSSRNVDGSAFEASDRRRGIGGQGQILRGMFADNAPTVGVQYNEPNKFDRSWSGSVNIPMDRGNVSLYGSRGINEGRPNDTAFGARLRIPI